MNAAKSLQWRANLCRFNQRDFEMKFFVDTADVSEIREIADAGLADGVTTNPSLIMKSGRDFMEVIAEICDMVEGPVSAEVTAVEASAMIAEGKTLAGLASNVVVKLPLTWDGLKACRSLSDAGIQTNVTLCFSANQGLLAAKAGATYISPFIGRLDDLGVDGMELIRDLRVIYDNYGFDTEILAASIRSNAHVHDCALVGADVVTAPPAVLRGLVKHMLTDRGLEAFLSDWKKTGQSIKT
jgi:transaldolase